MTDQITATQQQKTTDGPVLGTRITKRLCCVGVVLSSRKTCDRGWGHSMGTGTAMTIMIIPVRQCGSALQVLSLILTGSTSAMTIMIMPVR